MQTVCRKTKAKLLVILHTDSLKLPVEILNQEKMFALIDTRTIHELMEFWKPENITSSDQKLGSISYNKDNLDAFSLKWLEIF